MNKNNEKNPTITGESSSNQGKKTKHNEHNHNLSNSEHDHANCTHDHHHEHDHHDHSNCSHDHDHNHNHNHDHTNCSHDHHHDHESENKRHVFAKNELEDFHKSTIENLIEIADEFVSQEKFGKVVTIFEILLSKMNESDSKDESFVEDIINLKQNLAFSYGIINEHDNAMPMWKSVIEYKELNNFDYSELLDDYFGIALSCEHLELNDQFYEYIQKGLKLAKENGADEYVASFEHELGGYYCDKNDYVKAESHLLKAIELRKSLEDVVGLAASQMYMGIMFQELEKYDKAKSYFESALKLTKMDDYALELADERSEIEERLSQIQNTNLKNKLGNFSGN